MRVPGTELRRPSPRRLVLVAVIAALAVFAGVTAAGGISDAVEQLRQAQRWWMVPALVAVTVRFAVLGVQLRRLRGAGSVPSTPLAIGVAMVTFGLGGIMPASPAEGMALSVIELRRRSMRPRRASVMLMASQWIQFWALIALFAIDRLITAADGELRHFEPLRIALGTAALAVLVAAAMTAARRPNVLPRLLQLTRWLPTRRGTSRADLAATGQRWYEEVQLAFGSRRNQLAVSSLAVVAWLADATVLWCALRAAHAMVAFEVTVLAYTVAIAVQWVPLLPSGAGVVELAVPALLVRFGVPRDEGLAAVLMWRGVSLILPAAAGLVALLWLRARRIASPPRPAEPPLEVVERVLS